jgi:hypothetical protein
MGGAPLHGQGAGPQRRAPPHWGGYRMWRMRLLLHASIETLSIVRECHMQHVLYVTHTHTHTHTHALTHALTHPLTHAVTH